jgi:hypothetical protein
MMRKNINPDNAPLSSSVYSSAENAPDANPMMASTALLMPV